MPVGKCQFFGNVLVLCFHQNEAKTAGLLYIYYVEKVGEGTMRLQKVQKQLFAFFLMAGFWLSPVAAIAQTSVSAPKNKYKVQDDIELGRKTAVQVEQKYPILSDEDATRYVERVGRRLVAAIPPQFQQPAFDYEFRVVNASDINAFALPGGPMYVNRGMIEAARNEGEMAGVMAHEISHVALRHSTAQATKQSSAGSVLGQLGLILGGAVLGGQTGAQAGAYAAAAWMTKYSREFESQADVLGARIMADAGYDPRDLANMFQTIAQQGGSRGPEWLSSHPDPGNRYQKINQEASKLRVSPNPIKITRDFERVQARLRGMPPAPTMAQIDRGGYGTGTYGGNGTASGRYSNTVELPSTRMRQYGLGNSVLLNIPSNWGQYAGQSDVTFAPEGAYGSQGITHGVMVGVSESQYRDLRSATDAFVRALLQNNSYLRQESSPRNAYIGSSSGYSYSLTGRSNITGRDEDVTVYTAQIRDGRIFYLITVAPGAESYRYDNAFRSILDSVRF
jgi:Zn-dependent protease with chaperone function